MQKHYFVDTFLWEVFVFADWSTSSVTPHKFHIATGGFDFKTTYHKNPQLTTTYRQKAPIAQYVRRNDAHIDVRFCAICSIYIMPKALGDISTVSILIRGCVFYSPSLCVPPFCHFAGVQCGYILAHVHACVHACVYVCMRRACVNACMRACERACERACVRASVRASVRACVRACVRASVHACASVRACDRACEHACVRACVRASVRASERAGVRACVRESVRASVRACASVRAIVRASMRASIY